MGQVDMQRYHDLLNGSADIIEESAQQVPKDYYQAPPRSRSIILQEHETRDDRERNFSSTLPEQYHVRSDDITVSVPVEGIIQVEIHKRESIPGITFSRLPSSGTQHSYALQIDYIHADSSFYQSPLVPGLVIRYINGQRMIQQSPQDAQRELVNKFYPKTRIQVFGYIGKAYKKEKSTKLGLVLKDSSTTEGVYISAIKHDSIFLGTGLKPGLKVISINKRPCPQDILKAIKRLQRITGALEIVAVDTPGWEDEYTMGSDRESYPYPSHRPVEEYHVTNDVPAVQSRDAVSSHHPVEESNATKYIPPLQPSDKFPREGKDETIQIISLLHIEEPPLPENYEIPDLNSLVQTVCHEDDSSNETSFASRSTFVTGAKSRNSLNGNTASDIHLFNSKNKAQQKHDDLRTAATENFFGEPDPSDLRLIKLCEGGPMQATVKEKWWGASDPEDARLVTLCEDRPVLCNTFLDEVSEFVKDHTAMLNNAIRKILGNEQADLVLGEKESTQWRLVDVRQYSQIESMPSIVVESVDQPTPPMILGLAPTKASSHRTFDKIEKKPSLVELAVPQQAASFVSIPSGGSQVCGKDPGLIVTGLEMNFTERAVFIAKDSKQVRGGDNIVMAMLLFADNALLKMDKMCFS